MELVWRRFRFTRRRVFFGARRISWKDWRMWFVHLGWESWWPPEQVVWGLVKKVPTFLSHPDLSHPSSNHGGMVCWSGVCHHHHHHIHTTESRHIPESKSQRPWTTSSSTKKQDDKIKGFQCNCKNEVCNPKNVHFDSKRCGLPNLVVYSNLVFFLSIDKTKVKIVWLFIPGDVSRF